MQGFRSFFWLYVLLVSVAPAQARREIAFPAPPGLVVLKCDFHMHTVFSDGSVWPSERVHEAWREGLDAIAITDHIEYQPHRSDVPTRHNRPYEIALPLARERGILLIRGTEITRETPPGHFNAIFLADVDPLDVQDLLSVFAAAAAQNAFVFWNHPGWKGEKRGAWGEVQQTLFERGWLHGIEISNGGSYYAYAHRYALDKNLVLIGTSDVHGPSQDFHRCAEKHRTLTLVLATEKTEQALAEALRAGRTAIWQGNRLVGREPELRALLQAAVTIHPPHHRAGDRVWLRVENGCEVDLRFERTGALGPRSFTLPARATTLVRLDGPAGRPGSHFAYRVASFLTGPERGLEVEFALPE